MACNGMLKTVANCVLGLKTSSTYPSGKERVLARLGSAGAIVTVWSIPQEDSERLEV